MRCTLKSLSRATFCVLSACQVATVGLCLALPGIAQSPSVNPTQAVPKPDHAVAPKTAVAAAKQEDNLTPAKLRNFTRHFCFLPHHLDPRGLGLTPTAEQKKSLECADKILNETYFKNAHSREASNQGNTLMSLPLADKCSLKRILGYSAEFSFNDPISAVVAAMAKLKMSPREQDNLAFCYFLSHHRNPTALEKKSPNYIFETELEKTLGQYRLTMRKAEDAGSWNMLFLNGQHLDKVAPPAVKCAEGDFSTAFEAYAYREVLLGEPSWDADEQWRKFNPEISQKLKIGYDRRQFLGYLRLKFCDLQRQEGNPLERIPSAVKFIGSGGQIPSWITEYLVNVVEGETGDTGRLKLTDYIDDGFVAETDQAEGIGNVLNGCPVAKAALQASLKKSFFDLLKQVGPHPHPSDLNDEVKNDPYWIDKHEDPKEELNLTAQQPTPPVAPTPEESAKKAAAEQEGQIKRQEREYDQRIRRGKMEGFLQKSLLATRATSELIRKNLIPCGVEANPEKVKQLVERFIPSLDQATIPMLVKLNNAIQNADGLTHEFNPGELNELNENSKLVRLFKLRETAKPIAPYCLFTAEEDPRIFSSDVTKDAELRKQIADLEPLLFPAAKATSNAVDRSFLWSSHTRVGTLKSEPLPQASGTLSHIVQAAKNTTGIAWDVLFANTAIAKKERAIIFPPDKGGDYGPTVLDRIKASPFPVVSAAIVREHILDKLEAAQLDRTLGPAKVLAPEEAESFAKLRAELCAQLRKDGPRAKKDLAHLKRFNEAVRNLANKWNPPVGLTEDRMRLFLSLEPVIRENVITRLSKPCFVKYPEIEGPLLQNLVSGTVVSFSSDRVKGEWVDAINRYSVVCQVIHEIEERSSPAFSKAPGFAILQRDLLTMSLDEMGELLDEIIASPRFGKFSFSNEKKMGLNHEESTVKPVLKITAPADSRLDFVKLPSGRISKIYAESAVRYLNGIHYDIANVFGSAKDDEGFARADWLVGNVWTDTFGTDLFARTDATKEQKLAAIKAHAEQVQYFVHLRRLAVQSAALGKGRFGEPSKEVADSKELLRIRERGRELLTAVATLKDDLQKSLEPGHQGLTPEALLRGIVWEQTHWNKEIERLKTEAYSGKVAFKALKEAVELYQDGVAAIESEITRHIIGQRPLPRPNEHSEINRVNLRFPRGSKNQSFGFEISQVPLEILSRHPRLSDGVFEYMRGLEKCGANEIQDYCEPEDGLGYFTADTNYRNQSGNDEEKRARLKKWVCWAAKICVPLTGNNDARMAEICRKGGPAVNAIRDYIDQRADLFVHGSDYRADTDPKVVSYVNSFVGTKLSGHDSPSLIEELTRLKRSSDAGEREIFAKVASVMMRLPPNVGSDLFVARLIAPAHLLYALENQEAAWQRDRDSKYRLDWQKRNKDALRWGQNSEFDRFDPFRSLLRPQTDFDRLQGRNDPLGLFSGSGRRQLNQRGFADEREMAAPEPLGRFVRLPDGSFKLEGTRGLVDLGNDELTIVGSEPLPWGHDPKAIKGSPLVLRLNGKDAAQPLAEEQLAEVAKKFRVAWPNGIIPLDFPDVVDIPGGKLKVAPTMRKLTLPDGREVLLPAPSRFLFAMPGEINLDGTSLVGPVDPAAVRLGDAGDLWDPDTLSFGKGSGRFELPLTHTEIVEFKDLLRQAPMQWMRSHEARALAKVPPNRSLREELGELRLAVTKARNDAEPNVPEDISLVRAKTPDRKTLLVAHTDFMGKINGELRSSLMNGKWDNQKLNDLKLPFSELELMFERAELLGGDALVLQEVRNLIEDQRAYLRLLARSNKRVPICFHPWFQEFTGVKPIEGKEQYTCLDINSPRLTAKNVTDGEAFEKALAVVSAMIKNRLDTLEIAAGRGSFEFSAFANVIASREQEQKFREDRILAAGGWEKGRPAFVSYGDNWSKPMERQTLLTSPRTGKKPGNYFWSGDVDTALFPAWTKIHEYGPTRASPEAADRKLYRGSGVYGEWETRLNEELGRVDIKRAMQESILKQHDYVRTLATINGEEKTTIEGLKKAGELGQKAFEARWKGIGPFHGLAPEVAAVWNTYPPYMRDLLMKALERPPLGDVMLEERFAYPSGGGTGFVFESKPIDTLAMDPSDLHEWVNEPWPGKILGLARKRHTQDRWREYSTRSAEPLLATACERMIAQVKQSRLGESPDAKVREVVRFAELNVKVVCDSKSTAEEREMARSTALTLLRGLYSDNPLLTTAALVTPQEWVANPPSDTVKALRLALTQQLKAERDSGAGKLMGELSPEDQAKQLLSFMIHSVEDWGNEATGDRAIALEMAKGGLDRYAPIHSAVLGTMEQISLQKNAATKAHLSELLRMANVTNLASQKTNEEHDAKERVAKKGAKPNPILEYDEMENQAKLLDRSGHDSVWVKRRFTAGHVPVFGASLSSAQRMAFLGQDERSAQIFTGLLDHLGKFSLEKAKSERDLITAIQLSPEKNGIHWASQFDPAGQVMKKIGEAEFLTHKAKGDQLVEDLIAGRALTAAQLEFASREASAQWKEEEIQRRLNFAALQESITHEPVPIALVTDLDLVYPAKDSKFLPNLVSAYINNRKAAGAERQFVRTIGKWLAGKSGPSREEKIKDIYEAINRFTLSTDQDEFADSLPEWMAAFDSKRDAAQFFQRNHELLLPQSRAENAAVVGSLERKDGKDRESAAQVWAKWLLTQALVPHATSGKGTTQASPRPLAVAPTETGEPNAAVEAPEPPTDWRRLLKDCDAERRAFFAKAPDGWAKQVERGRAAQREVFQKREILRLTSLEIRKLRQKVIFVSKQIPGLDESYKMAMEAQKPTREHPSGNDRSPYYLAPEATKKIELKLGGLRKNLELLKAELTLQEKKMLDLLEDINRTQNPVHEKVPEIISADNHYSIGFERIVEGEEPLEGGEITGGCKGRYAEARKGDADAKGLSPWEGKKFIAQEREFFGRLRQAQMELKRYMQSEVLHSRSLNGVPDEFKKLFSDLAGNRFDGDVDYLSQIWNDLLPKATVARDGMRTAMAQVAKYGLSQEALRSQPPDFSGFKIEGKEKLTGEKLKELLREVNRWKMAEVLGHVLTPAEWENHPLADRLYDAFEEFAVKAWISDGSPSTLALNKGIAARVIPVSADHGGNLHLEFSNLYEVKAALEVKLKRAKEITDNQEMFLDLRASQNHTTDLAVWAISSVLHGFFWGPKLEDVDWLEHKQAARKNIDAQITELNEIKDLLADYDGLKLDWDGGTQSGLAISTHLDIEKESGMRDQLTDSLANAEADRYWMKTTGAVYGAAIVAATVLTVVTWGGASPLLVALCSGAQGAATAGTLTMATDVLHDTGYRYGRDNGGVDEKTGAMKANWGYDPNRFYKDVGPEAILSMAIFAAGSGGATYITGMAGRALAASKAAQSAGVSLAEAQAAAKTVRALHAAGNSAADIAKTAEHKLLQKLVSTELKMPQLIGGLTAADAWAGAVAQGALRWSTATHAATMYATGVGGRYAYSVEESYSHDIPFHHWEVIKQNMLSELVTVMFLAGIDRGIAKWVGPQVKKLWGTNKIVDFTVPAGTLAAGSANFLISSAGKKISERFIEAPKQAEQFQEILKLMESGEPDDLAKAYQELAKFAEGVAKHREEKESGKDRELVHSLLIDFGMFGRKAAMQSAREQVAAVTAGRIARGESPSVAIARMRATMKGGLLGKVLSPIETAMHSTAEGIRGPHENQPHNFKNIIDVAGGAHIMVALKEAAPTSKEAAKLYSEQLDLMQRRMKHEGLEVTKLELGKVMEKYVKSKSYAQEPLMAVANREVFVNGEPKRLKFDGGIMSFYAYAKGEILLESAVTTRKEREAYPAAGNERNRAIANEREVWQQILAVSPTGTKEEHWERVATMPAVLLTHTGKPGSPEWVKLREQVAAVVTVSHVEPADQAAALKTLNNYLSFVIPTKPVDTNQSVGELITEFKNATPESPTALNWMRENKVGIAQYRGIFGDGVPTALVVLKSIAQNDATAGGRQVIRDAMDFARFFESRWAKTKYAGFSEKQWLDLYMDFKRIEARGTQP